MEAARPEPEPAVPSHIFSANSLLYAALVLYFLSFVLKNSGGI
jgi:hypothetical protein